MVDTGNQRGTAIRSISKILIRLARCSRGLEISKCATSRWAGTRFGRLQICRVQCYSPLIEMLLIVIAITSSVCGENDVRMANSVQVGRLVCVLCCRVTAQTERATSSFYIGDVENRYYHSRYTILQRQGLSPGTKATHGPPEIGAGRR